MEKFNKCQTPLEELCLDKYPQEVQEQFWDFLNNVPFIRWMVSLDRPLISEVPRDEYGRAIIDVTKPPILEGSDYFRQSAIEWQEKGKYTLLRPNVNPSSDFGRWLLEEKRRGWEGFVSPETGMWVTGDYYWMLNYCPMHMIKKSPSGLTQRVVQHPNFWDGQFFTSHYFYQARLHGHHAAELASRGKGKTTLGAAMLSKRFIIGEFEDNQHEVQCFVTAADRTKMMNPNQILSVFVDNIDFCAKNTQFDSRRLKSSNQEMSWKMGYNKSGSTIEFGSKNTVTGVITGVDQDKLNGSRGVLYLIEEAGIFKDLRSLYNMIRPSVEQGTDIFGEIVSYGTAGDDQSDFVDFAEMIYSPEGFNLEPLDNVYDKEGQGRRHITMFYPAYLNYDTSCIDKDGNSDVTKALLMICNDRYKVKYGTSDINTITKRISQYPVTPQEAIIRSQGNVFPVTELNERLNQIDNNPNEYDDVYVGELVQIGPSSDNPSATVAQGKYIHNGVQFKPTGDIPIRDFPTSDNKVLGALEIYSMPQTGSDGTVPYGRYLISCLKEGEKVNTSEGLKSVEAVTLQDKLINIEGEFVDIKNLQVYHNEKPVYTVKLFNIYNSTTFSDEHPIYCATPQLHYHHSTYAKKNHLPYRYFTYDFEFKKVKNLRVGDVVKSPNVYRKELPYLHYWKDDARIDRRIDNPLNQEDFWWLIGLIIGDGWATCNGYNIHISFNTKESYYIQKAKRIVNSLFGRSFTQLRLTESCAEYSFCFQTLNTFIRTYIGCGAENKHISEWIKYLPLHLKKHLILGYLSSDGSVSNNKIEFVSTSLQLLKDVQDILFSLGIIGGISKMKKYACHKIQGRTIKTIKDKYHLRISKEQALKMKAWNAEDIKLAKIVPIDLVASHNYKRVWMSEDLKYIYFKVASIETADYVGNVYNFECDTHTFMCNYIPTHNCDPFDSDVAKTMSLGAVLVLDTWTDTLVAEYTGRPMFAEDLYEKVRLLCLFYNTQCMYENNLKGMFSYFSSHSSTHLLANTPEFLKERQMVSTIGYGNAGKGIRATTPIINGAFKMINSWLRKPVVRIEKGADGQEHEVSMPNLFHIRNRALLKELIQWNPYGNYDRVMSLVQLILYREEKMILYQGNMRRTETHVSGMEDDDYWSRNYPGNKESKAAAIMKRFADLRVMKQQ